MMLVKEELYTPFHRHRLAAFLPIFLKKDLFWSHPQEHY